ncbi:unnamed protein product [Miscanthus lutarioriparius]|uniref:Uncharacterized protein n=1 Tax=Miscanthus lutarioriparius TaxID=422564 RepID=A0A811Q0C0_9POAL|nr:unnamed protein product [Miscanthus lutarioriparius]
MVLGHGRGAACAGRRRRPAQARGAGAPGRWAHPQRLVQVPSALGASSGGSAWSVGSDGAQATRRRRAAHRTAAVRGLQGFGCVRGSGGASSFPVMVLLVPVRHDVRAPAVVVIQALSSFKLLDCFLVESLLLCCTKEICLAEIISQGFSLRGIGVGVISERRWIPVVAVVL